MICHSIFNSFKKTKIRNLIFVFFYVLLSTQFVFSQTYYFRNYSVEDGLPFIQVSAIFQDNDGNLWSGGYGGLSKFDGVTFKNFTPTDGLLNHSVTCINQDNQHNLWIGTIAGISKLNNKTFKSFTTKDGLISNQITTSLKDNEGNLWFGTNKGISKLSNGIFKNFNQTNGLVSDDIKCFFQDSKMNIWIGTSNGISLFDGKEFLNISQKNNLLNTSINGITEDDGQNIWVATTIGLFKISNNKISLYQKKDGLIDNNIKAIIKDNKNRIWLGTDFGLIKFENNKFTNLQIRNNRNSNLISCFYQDYENNLWIGTYEGLFKYRGNPFVSYDAEDGLTNNLIFGITRDAKNNLWIGSQGGGLFKFKENKFYNYNSSNGLNATTVNAIYEEQPENLWLATDSGLFFYDEKKFSKKKDTSSIFKNTLNFIYKDSKNNIWLAGNNEVYKYDGKQFSNFKLTGRNENLQVWTIIEDNSGTLWLGSYLGGLFKYDGKLFTECSQKIGFINDSYLASVKDKEGFIYFASLDGVWMFNPKTPNIKPVNFNHSHGLSSDLVYSLTFGKFESELWAGTNQGINKIDISEYKKNGQKNIISFGKHEGFTGVECNSNGTWVDNDGSIWFGTVYGIIKYDPNEYVENKEESKTSITGISLFYHDTLLQDKIHLSYHDNNISFSFSGICLTNPDKVKYSYILKGFEKKWSPPSMERVATYSNLPPGTYTFEIKSTNNENLWNKIPAHYTFTINPPFWKTLWFNISLVVFLLLILFFIYRIRIKQIRIREEEKTAINIKIANIESQALRAQMNPHFIFNIMSSIQHYMTNNDSDSALKYLSKFARLMRKIMDNTRHQMISVGEETEALNLYLELEVMRFDKKFEYIFNIDKTIDLTYDQIPSMLIQPYVENSIIHGLLPRNGEGKITITLQKQKNVIFCVIEDNGIGRTKSMEYKSNRIQQHKSMGMGITKERLEILNSSLKNNIFIEILDLYENGIAAGTRVEFFIPVKTD